MLICGEEFMADKDKPEIDPSALKEQATEDPKSKRWNNPNSRKNLKQYQDEPLVPEIILDGDEDDGGEQQAADIVRGRKISPELVRKLIPKRKVFTSTERERFNGIVTTFLSDFKNEEPTASDIDDILEIAKCDIMETRLLEVSRNDPATLVNVSQSIERFYKRKQMAKESLSARRSDRKDARQYQDLNIVDLIVRFDNDQRHRDHARVEEMLREEDKAKVRLNDVLEKDGY